MIKKFCLTCGNVFNVSENRRNSAKFCSRECKHTFSRTNKKCLFCGKPFKTPNHLNRKYCSHKCATKDKRNRIFKICGICGKRYEVQRYAKNSRYCGIDCRNKGISKSLAGRFSGKENPNYKGRIIKTCKYCNKLFEVYPYRKNTANYCSISCSKFDTSDKTRKKIAESVKKLQKENPKIHPNYIMSQKGHITQIEKLIKDELIRKKMHFKFQYMILNYWLDFAFPEIKLAIECDGERWHSTKEQISKDFNRDKQLCKHGWNVLRFNEHQILRNLKGCIQNIQYMVKRLKYLNDTARGEGGFGSTGKK